MTDAADIAVVVVNYNTCAHLQACLTTIYRAGAEEVVVVDAASQDGSAGMVRTLFPETLLHASPANRGYGAGANEGIKRCQAPYVLLLNSDTLLAANSLLKLAQYLEEHPRVAVAAPQLVNPDGTLQPCAFPPPSALSTLIRESSLKRLAGPVPALRRRFLEPPAGAVPWVLGAALALRRDAFDSLDGFDERFFMYFEEVDLCYRLRDAGWEVHLAPVTSVVHFGGASTRALPVKMTTQLYRSHLQFARRHFSRGGRRLLQVVLAYVVIRNYLRDFLRLRLAAPAPFEQRLLSEALQGWAGALSELGRAQEKA